MVNYMLIAMSATKVNRCNKHAYQITASKYN